MTILELQNKWNAISPLTGGYLLVSEEHPLSFHIGYSNGAKSFVIMNTGRVSVPSSKAINASCIETASDEFSLCFSLLYESLEELFIKLCWDLIEFTKNSTDPVKEILNRYINWLDLLQKVKEGLLSSSVQKGLIGELLYLNELIDIIGEDSALNSWVGPEGSDQDFLLPDSWSEVKAVSISSNEVGISSLQQLDREDDGTLIVYFMDKTSSEGLGTCSIYSVFEDLKSRIKEQRNFDILVCKLAKIGLLERDIPKYKGIHYRFAEQRKYNVTKDFPRLTRNNIPAEVSSAKYGIDLATIDIFKIEE